jgi:hypothetical protein
MPTMQEIEDSAKRAGYTKRVLAFSDGTDLDGWVKPDADLNGTVLMIDAFDATLLKVNGWLFDFEDAE